jgi:hypothetical protein
MRKFILAATAIAGLAVPALAPALASANVQRYETATLTSTVNSTYVHTYKVEIGPDGSFAGTGSVIGINETISGTINGSTITFKAAYIDGSGQPTGYTWTSNGTSGTDNSGQQLTVASALTNVSNENHGDFVSSLGGGADAAHSLIGMPVNSSK